MLKRRPSTIIAWVLAGLGVFIPPRTVAELIDLPDVPHGDLAGGLWTVKAVLLVLAAAIFLTQRTPVLGSVDRPLMRGGLAPSTPPVRYEHLIVGFLLVAGSGLRFWHLGDGLWFDEIETLLVYGRRPLHQIALLYDSQNNHLLFSLAARVSIVAFGESAWALRLPAAVLGVASIWAVYRFGLAVTARREALLAAALLTFSYHHVWFSQNARGYTGLLLWTLLGTLAFLRLLSAKQITWGLVLGYGAAMALAGYTHVTAALTVVAHAIVWLVLVWHKRGAESARAMWPGLAGLVWATVFTLALYAIVFPQFIATILSTTQVDGVHGVGQNIEWQNPLWLISEALRGLHQGLPGGLFTVALGVGVTAVGVVSYWRQSWLIAALMLLPGPVTLAVAVALSHNLWPRFFFFLAGFALMLAFRGGFRIMEVVAARRGTVLAAAGAVGVIVASALTVPAAWGPKQDFSGAADYIDRVSEPGDAVVALDLTEVPFRGYLERPWLSAGDSRVLEAIERQHPRTWVLFTFPIRVETVFPDIWERVHQMYDTAAIFPGTVGGGAINIRVRR